MNTREKEAYLREYSILKAQGKPFFPYAVAKDSLMAVVVMISIIGMSLVLGAELGPKVDPTTTTYTPRPEWYFFFLFEVLRVLKPPSLTPLAVDRRADDLHDPAVPAAVLRPRPRAAARAPADRDGRRVLHDRRDGLPHVRGRERRLAEPDRHGGARERRRRSAPTTCASGSRASRWSRSRAAWRATRSAHNGGTLGPDLSEIGDRLARQAIARTLVNPTAPMPAYTDLSTKKRDDLVEFLAQLKSGSH